MKCVWITGVATFLAVVISLALLPCLVPAPIHEGGLRTVDAAVTPLQTTDIQLAADKTGTLPNTMVFTATRPQVVGRLYLNAERQARLRRRHRRLRPGLRGSRKPKNGHSEITT